MATSLCCETRWYFRAFWWRQEGRGLPRGGPGCTASPPPPCGACWGLVPFPPDLSTRTWFLAGPVGPATDSASRMSKFWLVCIQHRGHTDSGQDGDSNPWPSLLALWKSKTHTESRFPHSLYSRGSEEASLSLKQKCGLRKDKALGLLPCRSFSLVTPTSSGIWKCQNSGLNGVGVGPVCAAQNPGSRAAYEMGESAGIAPVISNSLSKSECL